MAISTGRNKRKSFKLITYTTYNLLAIYKISVYNSRSTSLSGKHILYLTVLIGW